MKDSRRKSTRNFHLTREMKTNCMRKRNQTLLKGSRANFKTKRSAFNLTITSFLKSQVILMDKFVCSKIRWWVVKWTKKSKNCNKALKTKSEMLGKNIVSNLKKHVNVELEKVRTKLTKKENALSRRIVLRATRKCLMARVTASLTMNGTSEIRKRNKRKIPRRRCETWEVLMIATWTN
jgi:hypothetical protein